MTPREQLIEDVARAVFDGRPHNVSVNGVRQIPDWDIQPEHLKDVFRRDAAIAIAIVVRRCAEACRQQAKDFLSPEYATGQPISTISERFACGECEHAILALHPDASKEESTGGL